MTNSIGDLAEADCFLITGSNTTENHPVISTIIKQAVSQRGAKLILADPRGIDLSRFATIWLRQKPGTDVAWLNGMAQVIISEGLADGEFIAERTENFDGLKEAVKTFTPDYVESITGIPKDKLVEAARLYARADAAAILYAMGITQHTKGTNNVKCIANLAMLTGNIGRPGTGVNPLRGQNNVQGACDMGALPNVYSGYQQVANEDAAKKFEKAWGTTLSRKPGITIPEMIEGATQGSLKALFVMGENPMVSDPDINHLEQGLKNLDLLVSQDIFLHETGHLADVVLPLSSMGRKGWYLYQFGEEGATDTQGSLSLRQGTAGLGDTYPAGKKNGCRLELHGSTGDNGRDTCYDPVLRGDYLRPDRRCWSSLALSNTRSPRHTHTPQGCLCTGEGFIQRHRIYPTRRGARQ